jgi:hypothetical protein
MLQHHIFPIGKFKLNRTDQQGTAINWQLSTHHNVVLPTVAIIFKASLLGLLNNCQQICKIYLDLTNLMSWYNRKKSFQSCSSVSIHVQLRESIWTYQWICNRSTNRSHGEGRTTPSRVLHQRSHGDSGTAPACMLNSHVLQVRTSI